MNILIADKLSERAISRLKKLGATVDFQPSLTAEKLSGAMDSCEILVVRSTAVDKQAITGAKNLALVIRAGAGVNTIDLETASDRGVQVANCPGKNADAVAELAIGLMVALDRNIVANSMDLRNGIWNKKLWSSARGLKGKTLGILGYGAIGKKTASIARSMGMNIAAWSRSLTPEAAAEQAIEYCPTPLDLAGCADVVSIHLAASPQTNKLVDKKFLESMKEGSYLINCARGEIVDNSVLLPIAKARKIQVALDVYSDEPGGGSSKFTQRELAQYITGTHHIGASTDQAAEAIADEVVRIAEAFINTGKAVNRVNTVSKSSAASSLVVRHYNRVGALAAVLDELRSANINVEEMENSIFPGGKAAVCSLRLDSPAPENVLASISSGEHIISLSQRDVDR